MPSRIRTIIKYPETPKQAPDPTRRVNNVIRNCRPWTEQENMRMHAAYRKLGSRALAAELNRDYRAIQNRARVLGIAVARTVA